MLFYLSSNLPVNKYLLTNYVSDFLATLNDRSQSVDHQLSRISIVKSLQKNLLYSYLSVHLLTCQNISVLRIHTGSDEGYVACPGLGCQEVDAFMLTF